MAKLDAGSGGGGTTDDSSSTDDGSSDDTDATLSEEEMKQVRETTNSTRETTADDTSGTSGTTSTDAELTTDQQQAVRETTNSTRETTTDTAGTTDTTQETTDDTTNTETATVDTTRETTGTGAAAAVAADPGRDTVGDVSVDDRPPRVDRAGGVDDRQRATTDREGRDRPREQGVETGDGPLGTAARDLEQRYLEQLGIDDPSLVVVSASQMEDGGTELEASLTDEGLRRVAEQQYLASNPGVDPGDVDARVTGDGDVRLEFSGEALAERRFNAREGIRGAGRAVQADRARHRAALVAGAPAAARRAVAQTPDADPTNLRVLSPEQQRAVNERIIRDVTSQQSAAVRRMENAQAAAAPDFGRAFDSGVLLGSPSSGAQFFGTEARERAIEREAMQGSVFAQTFVGGESLEQLGLEGTRMLDEAVPDAGDPHEVMVTTSTGQQYGTGIELNPRVGIGTEGKRVGTQVRRYVVGAPAGLGVAAGLGPKAVGDVGLRAEELLGRDVEQSALLSSAATTGAVGVAGKEVVKGAKEEPIGAALDLATPFAVSKVSPVRFRRFDVPQKSPTQVVETPLSRRIGATAELAKRGEPPSRLRDIDVGGVEATPTQTVRGVRIEKPAVVQHFGTPSRGRTVLGSKGLRPTRGAPDVDPNTVDLTRMGGRPGGTTEPVDPFETDVLQATGRAQGGQVRARTEAVEGLVSQADRAPIRGEVASAREIVGEVQAVPEARVDDVVVALRDTDATIFGSAAVRGQVADFRTPRDLDVVVPDKSAARQRFAEALEGSPATVGDVFDIKAVSDAPGRARGGERIKFGRGSREKLVTEEGVRVNPVEEELVRKAGAAGFFREPGAAGTREFDVGPEPRRPGRADVREKDVFDAATIGREVLGSDAPAVRRFEESFGLRDPEPEVVDPGLLAGVRGEAGRFLAEERAQATLATRRRDVDVDGPVRRQDAVDVEGVRVDDAPSPTRAADSPSPGRRAGLESPGRPMGVTGASSPLGRVGRRPLDEASPAAATGSDASPTGVGVGEVRDPSPAGADVAAGMESPGVSVRPSAEIVPVGGGSPEGAFGPETSPPPAVSAEWSPLPMPTYRPPAPPAGRGRRQEDGFGVEERSFERFGEGPEGGDSEFRFGWWSETAMDFQTGGLQPATTPEQEYLAAVDAADPFADRPTEEIRSGEVNIEPVLEFFGVGGRVPDEEERIPEVRP